MATNRSASVPPAAHDDNYHGDGGGSEAASSLYARCDGHASRTLNARRLRQAADSDVQFLQNRINKLKQEEAKAKEEISVLREKTHEVSQNRQRHMEHTSQRQTLQDQVDYGKRKEAALIALNKERQSKAVWSSKQKVVLDRREAVLAMRKQKEINECRIHILKEEARDRHAKQRESIRELHTNSRLTRQREAESKREEVRDLHELRLRQEEEERERKERLAAQLVAQEAQLIYRLKRMHQERQDALRGLAGAVDQSVDRSHEQDGDRSAGSDRRDSQQQQQRPASRQALPPIDRRPHSADPQ